MDIHLLNIKKGDRTMALNIQRPTPPNDWLYQDRDNDERYFTTFIFLGKHESEWLQCTDEEKRKWEEDHPEPEPEPEGEQ